MVIGGERGIECHAQQPALAYGADGECKKGGWQQRSVLDHAELAALLAHEETAVRRELHGGRTGQSGGDRCFIEARRQRGRSRKTVYAPAHCHQQKEHPSRCTPPPSLHGCAPASGETRDGARAEPVSAAVLVRPDGCYLCAV